MRRLQAAVIVAGVLVGGGASAAPPDPQAAPSTQPASAPSKRTEVVVYPILAWLPIYGAHAILPNRPEFPGQPPDAGGGSSVDTSGSLNGAAFFGVSVFAPRWVLQVDLLWAGLSGEVDRPHAKSTADIILGGAHGGVQVGHGLAVVGGVRRIAADISIEVDALGTITRKPGVWDPLVGVTWRRDLGRRWNANVEALGGGFGVGSDVDLSLHARLNWDPLKHMRLAFGYGLLYLDLSHGDGDRTLSTQQTLYGPELGLGIRF